MSQGTLPVLITNNYKDIVDEEFVIFHHQLDIFFLSFREKCSVEVSQPAEKWLLLQDVQKLNLSDFQKS
jgi:hypothetical protein